MEQNPFISREEATQILNSALITENFQAGTVLLGRAVNAVICQTPKDRYFNVVLGESIKDNDGETLEDFLEEFKKCPSLGSKTDPNSGTNLDLLAS